MSSPGLSPGEVGPLAFAPTALTYPGGTTSMSTALVTMNLVGWLLAIAMIVALLLWATRHRSPPQRCPTCGVDRDKYPHKPRCNYWRD